MLTLDSTEPQTRPRQASASPPLPRPLFAPQKRPHSSQENQAAEAGFRLHSPTVPPATPEKNRRVRSVPRLMLKPIFGSKSENRLDEALMCKPSLCLEIEWYLFADRPPGATHCLQIRRYIFDLTPLIHVFHLFSRYIIRCYGCVRVLLDNP